MPEWTENMPEPTVGVVFAQDRVTAKNRVDDYGSGRLYITEECVCWISNNKKGFKLSYVQISLHAISKDLSSFPEECIYLLLDTGEEKESDEEFDMVSNGDGQEEPINGSSSNNDAAASKELCFVPEDKSALDAIFSAMSTCQALHPDPADVDSDAEANMDHDGAEDDEDLFQVAGTDGGGDLANANVEDNQFNDDDEDGNGNAPPPPHLGGGGAL